MIILYVSRMAYTSLCLNYRMDSVILDRSNFVTREGTMKCRAADRFSMWDPHLDYTRRVASRRRERKEGVLAAAVVPSELDLAGGSAVLEFSTRWHTTCGAKLI